MNESEQYVVLWFTKPNFIFPMYILLFAGWEVRIVKNCDRGLENARSQLFTIRTSLPANSIYLFFLRTLGWTYIIMCEGDFWFNKRENTVIV